MTCSYSWHDHSVVKTFTGFVSGSDFFVSTERVAADPRFDDLRIIYNDFLAITGHGIDARTYQRIAACRLGASLTNPNFRVAFIAAGAIHDELRESLDEADRTLVFHPMLCTSMAAAAEWCAQQPVLTRPRGFTRVGPAAR